MTAQLTEADLAAIEELMARVAATPEEPERKAKREQYQAFFDAALDTLRKGAPGLAEPSRVTIARSIALKCQAALTTPASKDSPHG